MTEKVGYVKIPQRSHILIAYVFAIMVSGILNGCRSSAEHDTEAGRGPKTECVGRYQITVPGDAEFALVPPHLLTEPNPVDPYQFKDGVTAPFTKIHYDGEVMVSPSPTAEGFKRVKDAVTSNVSILKARLKEGDKAAADQTMFVAVGIDDAFAWRVEAAVRLYLSRGEHIYKWAVSGFPDQLDRNLQRMQSFAKIFRTRPAFTAPREQGVCIPYGFIADEGKGWRDVGITMRLTEHPDVTVFFRDQAAREQPAFNAKREIQYFLESNYATSAKTIKLGFPSYRSVELDGRRGESTFVEIERHDGSQDFGYIAVVTGESGATVDTPTLTLIVIRTAAEAKGAPPVSEQQLKEMARAIAASVRRRI